MDVGSTVQEVSVMKGSSSFQITTEDLVMRSSHALSQPELRHRYGAGEMSAVKPMVKRRVSRVESLRNLFFSRGSGGGGQQGQQQGGASSGLEARKRFLLKKRARSAEKEKVRGEGRETLHAIGIS